MLQQQTQIRNFQFTFRNASIITATLLLAFGFVLYVWMEIATHSMSYPLAATGMFAAFFALPALLLLWRAPLRVKLAFISTFLLLILVVRNFEWNSRKPFLRALDAVQGGMTAEQVDVTMRGFVRAPRTGISEYGTVSFRHTEEGWGDADVGVVTFVGDKVLKVEFMGD